MQVYLSDQDVPTRGTYPIRRNAGREGRSGENRCAKCDIQCETPRKLPCGHMFCKHCLKSYFSSLSLPDVQKTFRCPRCRFSVESPSLPLSKWAKAFKMDKRTKFYSTPPKLPTDADATTQAPSQHTGTRHNVASRRAKSGKISRDACHRTAIYSRHHEEDGFFAGAEGGGGRCLFWAADCLPDRCLVLADWLNQCVKLYGPSKKSITHFKLPSQPLSVSYLHDDILLTSLGSRDDRILFLKVNREPAVQMHVTSVKRLHDSHLYSTTRFVKKCFGLFETPDRKVYIGIIQTEMNKTGTKFNIGITGTNTKVENLNLDPSVCLSSGSNLHYSHALDRLFITENRTLYCLKNNGKLLYKRTYSQQSTENYPLGAITSDTQGSVFIAANNQILHVNSDGDQLEVIPTKIDPYFLLCTENDHLHIFGYGDQVLTMTFT
ncbi:uncharacterized protein LOC128228814 [Mya arenaria]|uniref:uncharacterized protein LOC128228814 n=1 Tax=Mya arenaria TaxID=6604 RepID=UPI0022DF205A|nr:uncharacterized protein LOC128228814 [Mya arenaria]